MVTTPAIMTAEDLLGYDIPGKRIELVRGQLVVRDPSSFDHGDLIVRLCIAIGTHLAR